MLLTITTTHTPATDLGFVLMKHPDRTLERPLPFGQSLVFYPEATPERTTAALLVEVDPVALSRAPAGGESGTLEPYVNDRPYASGSFLSVALRDAFGTAMTGQSRDRPELAAMPLPLTLTLPCVAARGQTDLPERLFGPLGYEVEVQAIPLDALYPEWGERPYVTLTLRSTVRVADALRHLYVLLPVLDGKKHYYVGEAEVDKLLRHGHDWLDTHPERDLIAARYLRFRELVAQAQARLTDPQSEQDASDAEPSTDASVVPPPRVHDARLDAVAALLEQTGARRVLDLGCGEGKLLRRLLRSAQFRELVGVDLSARSLEIASKRLKLDERPELRDRVTLLHGSLAYPDSRLRDFDAAALVEVIEHLEPHRLTALTDNVLGYARPGTLIVTTPNREYNATFEEARTLRHADHRFEWTRAEFQSWAQAAAEQHGYTVTFQDLGDVHPEYGPITQLALFRQTPVA